MNMAVIGAVAAISVGPKKEYLDPLRLSYDPRLDNPSAEVVKSIPWQDLPRTEAINNIAKILNSPLLEAFTRGDFNFLDDIIRTKEIKFQDIAEAHQRLTARPWAEIIKDEIVKIKLALGLSNAK